MKRQYGLLHQFSGGSFHSQPPNQQANIAMRALKVHKCAQESGWGPSLFGPRSTFVTQDGFRSKVCFGSDFGISLVSSSNVSCTSSASNRLQATAQLSFCDLHAAAEFAMHNTDGQLRTVVIAGSAWKQAVAAVQH